MSASKRLADARKRLRRTAHWRCVAEDIAQPGAGVFGVQVDAAGPQRLERHLRARQIVAPLDVCSGVPLNDLRHQLGQDCPFGEVLGADNDSRSCGLCTRNPPSQSERPHADECGKRKLKGETPYRRLWLSTFTFHL